MPLDGKLPHWAVVEVLVCAMQGCSTNVHVKGFTVIVNGSIFGTLDTSLAYRCPHKNFWCVWGVLRCRWQKEVIAAPRAKVQCLWWTTNVQLTEQHH